MKKFLKIFFILLLTTSLNGCALVGTMLQLVPLVNIFVYHSAPYELDNGKIACIKTVRTYKKINLENGVSSKNIKNEYYICLVDYENKKIKQLTQILDDKYYELDDALIYEKDGKLIFALNNPKSTWQLDMDGSNCRKISNKFLKPSNYPFNKQLYAHLPLPQMKDISSE